jgi:hypothetical protein
MGQRSEQTAGDRRRNGGRARTWAAVAWLAMAAAGMAAGGCGGRPIFGELGRRPGTYDYKGEQVQVTMLSARELWNYDVPAETRPLLRGRLMEEFKPGIFPDRAATEFDTAAADVSVQRMRANAIPLAALVPLIAGFAVDAVRSELEKQASIHEAQFGRTIHSSGFWEDLGDKPRPRWLGFEIRRTTARTGGERPASRVVCLMIPAPYMKDASGVTDSTDHERKSTSSAGGPEADARLFVIKPLLFENRSAKAKLMAWEKALDATVFISLQGTWIDAAQTVHQETVAAAQFDVENYDMSTSPILVKELRGQIAGWFGGVPVSVKKGEPDQWAGNGTFRLVAAVTERDPSRVKEGIERAAKYLKDNRDQIVKQVAGTR